MKRIIAFILALAAFSGVYAQEIITGAVMDTDGAPVQSVTVKLVKGRLTRSFARTKSDGSYSLKVPRRSDSLSVTFEHLSYDKVTKPLPAGNVLDVVMTPRSRELREVVVAAPSVKLRGDTLSFFLDMFKGKGDVVLEDALKKIPGITVEDNGVIKYMGKDISNFYVEGLDMLGGRYSIATRSIPADYVKDVQVISNHHDLKIDKDKVSDNVAVNIKLKSKALFKPMGTVEAGGGYGDKRLRYALSGTGMLFKGSLQSLVTLKGGNMERFADNTNAVRIVGAVGNSGATAASSVVSAPEGAPPPLKKNPNEKAPGR
ncbi:MAG: carboxypeptidase-like regulatory domain-containing protein, partial [Paramuribaculum sp.]|nr:carboxypeptidase-like regulatory domain-containing protein [Paramuribaculum sp.]